MATKRLFWIISCLLILLSSQFVFASETKDEPSQINPIDFIVVDNNGIPSGQSSFNNPVIYNQHGIFMAYIHSSKANSTQQDWRLIRSTDGGKTFSIIYQEIIGTNIPVMETDQQGNIYLIRQDWPNPDSYLYIFKPGDNYSSHSTNILGTFIPLMSGSQSAYLVLIVAYI